MLLNLVFLICLSAKSLTLEVPPTLGFSESVKYPNRPHIIILMPDDMGFNDVSFRGSSAVLTPNIDALAYQGVILNRHYVPDLCTPSRAAFLTGKYPINTGMQHFVIRTCQPSGLPLELKLLPEYLKEVGYKTHIVGKWHLGYVRKSYTPTERGFDEFFGFYEGAIDYYNHTVPFEGNIGYDFRRNWDVTYEGLGQYSTYLFTNESLRIIRNHNTTQPLFLYATYNAPHAPMQAPEDEKERLNYIRDPDLRTYGAMLTILDRGIGQIISELGKKDMLRNSVILFYSDNGGPSEGLFETKTSNYPLRGQKYSPWEGGSRVPAALWSPLLEVRHGVSNRLIHNTDWLPTFLAMIGRQPIGSIDGYDMWPTLAKNLPSPRMEVIQDIDPIDGFSSYYRKGWKYINGTTQGGIYDSWLGTYSTITNPNADRYVEIVRNSDAWQALAPFATKRLTAKKIQRIRKSTNTLCQPKMPYSVGCDPLKGPCLFRLKEDPCELNNLAKTYPMQTYLMALQVRKYKAQSRPVIFPPPDYEKCNPNLYNGTFTWWLDIEPTTPISGALNGDTVNENPTNILQENCNHPDYDLPGGSYLLVDPYITNQVTNDNGYFPVFEAPSDTYSWPMQYFLNTSSIETNPFE